MIEIPASDVDLVQHALVCNDCTLIPGEFDITAMPANTFAEYVTWVRIEGARFTVDLAGPWSTKGDLDECEAWANRPIP